jgi:putative transposase
VRRQSALLGLNRSSLYYEPVGATAEDLRLMRLSDEEYTRHPFYGSRRLTAWLSPKCGGHFRRYPGRGKELKAVEAARCSQESWQGVLARRSLPAKMAG